MFGCSCGCWWSLTSWVRSRPEFFEYHRFLERPLCIEEFGTQFMALLMNGFFQSIFNGPRGHVTTSRPNTRRSGFQQLDRFHLKIWKSTSKQEAAQQHSEPQLRNVFEFPSVVMPFQLSDHIRKHDSPRRPRFRQGLQNTFSAVRRLHLLMALLL